MDPNTDERNLETELDYNKVEAEKTKHEPNTKKQMRNTDTQNPNWEN